MSDIELKGEYKLIDMNQIHADEDFNCRGSFAPMDVLDLAKDIDQNGLIQAVVISPYDEARAKSTGKPYRLVAGFRRHAAFKVLGKTAIPAIVRDDMMDDLTARFFNLSENLHRKDLNIMQEATAILKLKDLGLTETQTAERLGTSRGWVQIRYMLLNLPVEVQQEVSAGFITQTQIRELYAVFKVNGKDGCFAATRKLKDAKILGRANVSVHPNKNKPTSKKYRTRPEIFEMQSHIQSAIGNNIGTRCLAWAAGEIPNSELYQSIINEAAVLGIQYSPPMEITS